MIIQTIQTKKAWCHRPGARSWQAADHNRTCSNRSKQSNSPRINSNSNSYRKQQSMNSVSPSKINNQFSTTNMITFNKTNTKQNTINFSRKNRQNSRWVCSTKYTEIIWADLSKNKRMKMRWKELWCCRRCRSGMSLDRRGFKLLKNTFKWRGLKDWVGMS